LRIPWLLVGGARAVSEIHAKLPLSQSALPQHLARLCAAGLVTARREAQSMHYALATVRPRTSIATLRDFHCAA
jgi:DNA-binding transcriptional ArsR family regulator